MLIRPIIYSLKPQNASRNITINFDVKGGDQVYRNNLVIQKQSDNTVVYNQTVESFLWQHTIPANTLQNGVVYKIKIRTGNVNNEWSDFSDYIVLYCFSDPIINITNIVDGKVYSQDVKFTATYSQNENEQLESYKFFIYDEQDILLYTSPEKFGTPIEYLFTGFKNNQTYKVALSINTVNGLEYTTNKIPFLCVYEQPPFTGILLTAENQFDKGSIKVTANIKQIIGEVDSGTIQYIDGEWLDAKGGVVVYDKANSLFEINKDFALKVWLKDVSPDTTLLKLVGNEGYIELRYYNNQFHVFKKVGIFTYHTVSNIITLTSNDVAIVYLKHNNNMFDVIAEKVS